jgi:hypothetical protein
MGSLVPRRPWQWRLLLIGLALAWFLLPWSWQAYLPIWLPFLLLVVVEAQFFVQGLRWRGRELGGGGRGPPPRDRVEFGYGDAAQQLYALPGGTTVSVSSRLLDEAEIDRWAAEHEQELHALAPGYHELTLDPPAPAETAGPARPARRRARQALGAAATLAVLVALFVLSDRGGWSHLSAGKRAATLRVLSAEAARIAGHRAVIRCDAGKVGEVQGDEGLAEVGGHRAWLTPQICFRLYRLAVARHASSSIATSHAIVVFAHESWHLRGVADEGVANCYAYQSGVGIAERLGFDPGTARRMMRQQLVGNADFASTDPRYLVPSGCRNGGRYDLRPHDDRFP